jgi:sugar phosphate isomerase/epimerase
MAAGPSFDMPIRQYPSRSYSRREFGTLALAGLGGAACARRPDSRIQGVQIGAISYSFRGVPNLTLDTLIAAMTDIGLSEVELMSTHAEAGAGAALADPSAYEPGGTAPTAAPGLGGGDAAINRWRRSVSPDAFGQVRRRFADAGIDLRLLCFNMSDQMTDEEFDYAFRMARGLGARAITTSAPLSVATRIASFADRHEMPVAFHNSGSVGTPDTIATPESYLECLTLSPYHRVNLDIGNFTAAGFDAVAFLTEHHARVTNLHLKDRLGPPGKGLNVPWGQGDTPLRPILQLLKTRQWDIPANIEFEYEGDTVTEMKTCLRFCRDALA